MKPLRWLEIIVIFTVLTFIFVYLIPIESKLVLLRYIFSVIFLSVIPGNCLVNILFRGKNKVDIVEEAVLSVALSFGIVGITGLFLGLTQIGLNFTAITISSSSITLILVTAAFILKTKDVKNQNNKQQTTVEPMN